jgi:hypothetical protein
MMGGGVSHGEAGTRDWALARESLERPLKARFRSPTAGPVLGTRKPPSYKPAHLRFRTGPRLFSFVFLRHIKSPIPPHAGWTVEVESAEFVFNPLVG